MRPLVEADGTYYPATIRPLTRGDRRDVEIAGDRDDDTSLLVQLRVLFADLDAEAKRHAGDPIALTHALARLEALLADVRYVRDGARELCAEALKTTKVRRLTITDVATVEASNSIKRSGWQHRELMIRMLGITGWKFIDEDGVIVPTGAVADELLRWLSPDWRMTPLKDAGLKPDDYCTVERDDDGHPVATPDVKIVDNLIRRMGTQ